MKRSKAFLATSIMTVALVALPVVVNADYDSPKKSTSSKTTTTTTTTSSTTSPRTADDWAMYLGLGAAACCGAAVVASKKMKEA